MDWQIENMSSGRSHVLCCAIEFLNDAPNEDVLSEAFSRLTEYLSRYPGKFSNIARSEISDTINRHGRIILFDICCDFRNNDVHRFLDTVATLYSILMYISERHDDSTKPLWFHKYQIAYYPWNDNENERNIYHIKNNHPFEEIVFQMRNTFKHKQANDLSYITNGVDETHFFTMNETELYKAIISWVYKNQQRKNKVYFKWSHQASALERLKKSQELSVSRGEFF